ncbi:MAG: hypothetical protein M3N11_08160 [Actinomycetota bacterium]|nr:hypothetical protein [Actinomycetota bacterium]
MTGGGRRRPSPQELAAIVAAVELAWPGPASAEAVPAEPTPAWRFSGRWWRRPFPEAQPVVESVRAGSWAGAGGWPDPRGRSAP